ncbi:MAG: aminomethyltransferase, partial [Planctomycetota bacterium]
MPLPSPFHARTADLCTSLKWKTWAGTFAAASYGTDPESEFHAIRQTVAMIDVSPRYKVDVLGPDAASFLARVTSKDVTKLERGRCAYVCLCDDDGKLLDVGMLSYLDDQLFRLTTSAANLGWLND